MKKSVLCILMFLFLFAFVSGCAPKAVPQVKCQLNTEFETNIDGLKIRGRMISRKDSGFALEINEPPELSEISYIFVGDKVTLGYNALKAEMNEDYLTDKSFALRLWDMLRNIPEKAEYKGEDKDTYRFSLAADYGKCTFQTDIDGNILNAHFEDINCSVSFDAATE